jgi:hypothetical protein
MRRTFAAMIIGISAVSAAPAGASFMSGNMLLRDCTGADMLACIGYLEGVIDAAVVNAAPPKLADDPYLAETNIAELWGWHWCLPGNVTVDQVRDVAVKFLRDNPRDRHLQAAPQIARGFAEAWPCGW